MPASHGDLPPTSRSWRLTGPAGTRLKGRLPNGHPRTGDRDSRLDEILTPNKDGFTLALHDARDIAAVLGEQTRRAYRDAAIEGAQAIALYESALQLQSGLFQARNDILDDALHLEGVL
ncbi:hypothetical protein [Streptomyces sp. NBC_00470]|uniref:hypothetical protein n=1 Tax=Streptomyces sp. NBC_00470 TaxID=2975753 RepID=UPI002F916F8E